MQVKIFGKKRKKNDNTKTTIELTVEKETKK